MLGAGSFLIAQSRYIDAHAIDMRMVELAKASTPTDYSRYIRTFPAASSWLRPAREQFFTAQRSGQRRPIWVVNLAGLALLAMYLSPTIACFHFLMNWSTEAGKSMVNFQWWSVVVATVLDLLFLFLVARIYKAQEDIHDAN